MRTNSIQTPIQAPKLVSRIEPVLGTRLELQLQLRPTVASRLFGRFPFLSSASKFFDEVALQEIDRLAGIFSVFDTTSELRRWCANALPGNTQTLSAELAGLLSMSAGWQVASAGSYNPAVGAAVAVWKEAERSALVPSPESLDVLAATLGSVPYEVDGLQVHAVGDCRGLSFNALAKGLVADRTLEVLQGVRTLGRPRVNGAAVNIGGDIAVSGIDLTTHVENPLRPYDNEPPLLTLSVSSGGVATSGPARRGFTVDGTVYSHIIDPRTCRPVENGPLSATVIASSAAEADVLATVVSVTGNVDHSCIPPTARVVLVDQLGRLVTRREIQARPS